MSEPTSTSRPRLFDRIKLPEGAVDITEQVIRAGTVFAGIGSTLHVAGELFKMMTGVSMVHVPYRGEAPALTDLLGGQAQVMFGPTSASIQYIRAGSLRALGGDQRDTLGWTAGNSDRGRIRTGFRGERLVRHRRA
jgi:Tripartite tricarboxylate transporter family receptor